MKLYVDTADIAEARAAVDLGVVDGITTNPSLVAKHGHELKDLVRELAGFVDGEIWCQVISTDVSGMVAEAREIQSWADDVIVKLPMSLAALKAATQLSREGVRTNMTLVYSVPQALLAAKAGVQWISLYAGRIDDAGASGSDRIADMTRALRAQELPTQVLVASVRGPGHVRELAGEGVHGFTMAFDVLLSLAEHPMTDDGLERFLDDWQKAGLASPSGL
jgi:transaldolase